MNRLLRVGAIVVLLLTLLPGVALAAPAKVGGGTQANPTPLGTDPISDVLTGTRSGAFDYFITDYAGDGQTDWLNFWWSPGDKAIGSMVWVNTYVAGSKVGSVKMSSPGVGKPNVPPDSVQVPILSTKPGPAVIQIANFSDVTIGYTISNPNSVKAPAPVAQAAPAAAPAPAPAATPAAAATPLPGGGTKDKPTPLGTTPLSDQLPGTRAGSFDYFITDYAGDGQTDWLVFTWSPGDKAIGSSVWVNTYVAGSKVGSIKMSSPGVAKANMPPNSVLVPILSTKAGPAIIQVANFSDTTISYTISNPNSVNPPAAQ